MSTDSLNYPKSNINAYLELTKPSIIYLLVLTAATSMFLAGSFSTNLSQALTGILGIGMIAASSAAINQILDVSIDSKMKRIRVNNNIKDNNNFKLIYELNIDDQAINSIYIRKQKN